ncbi:hypothetical protein MUK42_27789 [Musa troglodytarum]|nr:hypothetical protein MUK42_27789 [Musa troglodytarum]
MVPSSYLPTGVSYCFVRVPRSKAKDNRLKRKTRGGTWVANGKPRDIPHQDRRAAIAGTRRSLKFFKDNGDPRKKNKKDSSLGLKWIMHEYRLHPSLYETIPSYETEEIILCRIQHKEEPQTRATATASQPRPHQWQTPHLWQIPNKRRSHGWRDLPPRAWQLTSLGVLGINVVSELRRDLPPRAWQLTSLGVLGINVVSELRRDLPPRAWQLTSLGVLGINVVSELRNKWRG